MTNNLDNHECVDVIYLDFAKAFDNVPHVRLLEKIDKHGIGGKVLSWLQQWLSGRKQRVCLNGCLSSWAAVTSRVPQCSVLGPVLFLIFINDLDSSLVSSVLKFADGMKLFGKVSNEGDTAVIQSDLDSLLEWSNRSQMPFNTSKCMLMHFGKKKMKYQYSMDNQVLQAVTAEKDLGVFITDDLKPARQCQEAYSKESKALGLIARTISFRNKDVLLKLY